MFPIVDDSDREEQEKEEAVPELSTKRPHWPSRSLYMFLSDGKGVLVRVPDNPGQMRWQLFSMLFQLIS